MALVENIQREDLDAIEVALTYQRLLEEIGLTQENLSQRVGKERSTITNSIRLLRLTPQVQNAIRSGEISAGHGRAIIGLEDSEMQDVLFRKIVNEGLNVRQAEAAAGQMKNPQALTPKAKTVIPNHLKKVQKTLSDILEVKVEVKASGKGNKGKIVLDFKNQAELDQILSHFKI